MKKFDLHIHSNYSKDGEFTPTELVQIAKEKDLEIVALCDHDCISGIQEMIQEAKKENITVIPAIECTTLFHNNECHLLGYGIDVQDPYFVQLKDYCDQLMDDAFHERIVKLEKKYPIHIDEQQVIKDAGNENPWFLMCNQIFKNPNYFHIEDFKDYIPGGKNCDSPGVAFFWDKCQFGSDLYVQVEFPDFKESVKKIHESGGIAVLAHPYQTFYENEEFLFDAINAGIDGIEVYSNYHEPKHTEYYKKFARKHGLLMTCGSDFHGKIKPNIQMGDYGFDDENNDILSSFLDKFI